MKRDFSSTPEPIGAPAEASRRKKKKKYAFVVQKHQAKRLHYDFRLEMDGVFKSWAVTKGPSINPANKRLAVRTEDHPLSYGDFEGVIPMGYGAGTVMLWDYGEWVLKTDPIESLNQGSLKFTLNGERLQGGWTLVLMKGAANRKGRENWLLIKERDDAADETLDPLTSWTDSVASGRGFKEIESAASTAKPAKSSVRASSGWPGFVEPQLASLMDEPPSGPGWAHEVKFDGYRIQALLAGRNVKLLTRNGKDWTSRYPSVAAALSKLNVTSAAVDGELVALDIEGRCDFSALQAATDSGKDATLAYFAFDLLSLDGKSLLRRPLSDRKATLRSLVPRSDPIIRYSDHVADPDGVVLAKACALGLEGVVSKKITAAYRSGRGSAWIKSKCIGRSEFVIGGYRRSDKEGRPFSSLLVGEFENGMLTYRGRVGSGFDEASFKKLSAAMASLENRTTAFRKLPQDARDGAVWVAPHLVVELAYAQRTAGGLLRHPTFLGLREDKAANQVLTRAKATKADGRTRKSDNTLFGVRLSNPGRVMFENDGVTKRDIAEYLVDFSTRILPFLKNHPVSLVRCPGGIGDSCFFQKHLGGSAPPALGKTAIVQSNGTTANYVLLHTPQALIAAAQLGVIELHIWGSRADRLEFPDRLVIDLDPDATVSFGAVRLAAIEVRDVLSCAGLQSFALLTGGKGIHVVAPLDRRRPWIEVKSAARGLARQMAKAKPDIYVSEMQKTKRVGKIFIDWLRNGRGATAICPYSLRARQGASIATPVRWDELAAINGANFYTISNIRRRIASIKVDPWIGYQDLRQSLTASVLKALTS